MVVALSVFPWLRPIPSDANFVLFEVLPPADAASVVASLRRRGVLIRYYPTGALTGYIRISAGRPQDTAGLVAVMRDIHTSFGAYIHAVTLAAVCPAFLQCELYYDVVARAVCPQALRSLLELLLQCLCCCRWLGMPSTSYYLIWMVYLWTLLCPTELL